MADYRLNGDIESDGVFNRVNNENISPENTVQWKKYEEWKDLGNEPDPLSSPSNILQNEYAERQAARTQQLKQAVIMQFKMILALFQVGQDKGVWVVGDFDSELVTQAQTWIALIDDYESDAP